MTELAPTTVVVAPAALALDEVTLEAETFHHLVRVKRLAAGAPLRLVDGRGRARAATLASIGRREAVARLGAEAASNEPAVEVELAVAPPKPERAAWLVEKATEIGVTAIRFLATGRAARAFAPAQLDRLRRVAVAAVEQCGRSRVPELSSEEDWEGFQNLLAREPTAVVVLDGGDAPAFAGALSPLAPPAAMPPRRVVVLVGPEGGWSDAEREGFATRRFATWSLGERALRVETAAVVGAGLVLAVACRERGGVDPPPVDSTRSRKESP